MRSCDTAGSCQACLGAQGIFPECGRAMPRSLICVEAQMGRPSTCCTQMGRKSILKPRGGVGSYRHPEDNPGTLSSATRAWVAHMGTCEQGWETFCFNPVCPGAGQGRMLSDSG